MSDKKDFIMKVLHNLQDRVESVDISKLTDAEIQALYDDCDAAMRYYEGMQRTVKDCANSVYGASGSPWFRYCNYAVAEDITNEGKQFLFMIDNAINDYYRNWASDTEIHEIIRAAFPAYEFKFTNSDKDICVYGDTDSRYLDYGEIFKLAGFKPKKCKRSHRFYTFDA